ncbi:MAG: hypothetical protein GW939_02425, partial [Candidatus Magasanikbacteria bacterium]|nr:hypothetical protein [Candidatus Magasanikbacteria bacterium]
KEQERKREKPRKEPTPKKESVQGSKVRNLIAVVLVIFIVISVGGLIFSVFGPNEKKEKVEEIPTIETRNFITADQERMLEVSGLDRNGLALLLEETAGKEEVAIKKVTLFNLITSDSEIKHEIDPKKFLETIGVQAPSSLLRSFGEKMDFGIYSLIRFSSFAIFEISDFGNSYSGMLKWEENIASDLRGWISNEIPEKILFSDMVYRNKDLRVLRNSKGEIVILYSFLDQKTLLITNELETFEEISNRMK